MFNFYIDKLTFLRKLRKDSYICELWASLRNDTADRHENHRQFGLTLLDSFDRQKIKSGVQRPLDKKTGRHRKAI